MWYLHDGAPAHHNALVNGELDELFPERWIGRDGTVHWSPRSPELNEVDYDFWGYIKDVVYRTPPTIVDNMKIRIQNAFQSVTQQMLTNISRSFETRLQACVDVMGGHFEHLL
uniref:Uncharacterized protein LOC114339557 n=1 Tax=Diabrotica virgifera virgifera TaxID=50390 RepID=A0A6P7GJ75_DIAVI